MVGKIKRQHRAFGVATKDDLCAALGRGDDLLRDLRLERLWVEPADHVEMDAGWGHLVQEGGKFIDGLADEKPMTEEACELAGHGGSSEIVLVAGETATRPFPRVVSNSLSILQLELCGQ
jgi:hypothetical protein